MGEHAITLINEPQSDEVGQVFEFEDVVEAQMHNDGESLFIRSTNADAFFLAFNSQVVDKGWAIESMGPADETIEAIYQHLIVKKQVTT
jgi:hypothetical protein